MFKKTRHKGDPKVLIKRICLQTFSQEEYVLKKYSWRDTDSHIHNPSS